MSTLSSRNFTFMGTLLLTRFQLVNNVFSKKKKSFVTAANFT